MLFEHLTDKQGLSSTEYAIGAYIIQHPQEVLQMGVRDLAHASFSSVGAVMRLCKKLGLDSFTDLKIRLAKEAQGNHTLEYYDADFPDLDHQTADQVIKVVSALERQAIRETETLLKTSTFNHVVDELEHAPSVGLYGVGFSLNSLQNFESMLRRLGYPVTREEDQSRSANWVAVCNPKEFSVLVSYSGESMTRTAQILKRRHMRSVSITSNSDNTLSKLTTYHLPVASIEERFAFNRMGPLCSSLECSFVLDALYAALFSRRYTENCEKLNYALRLQGVKSIESLGQAAEAPTFSG